MSLFNQMIRGSGGCATIPEGMLTDKAYTSRTFKETLADQIAYHERKITELKAVYDSLTPELEGFVEALQKLG